MVGFFLFPIVFVPMLEVLRIVLPELLHGEPREPEPGLAEEAGTDAEEMQEDDADTATQDTDGTSTTRS